MTKLQQITEAYPEEQFIYPTGYEECIVGIETESLVLIMDSDKIIAQIMKEDGISHEDAQEHYSFNIAGSRAGEGYPIYIRTLENQ